MQKSLSIVLAILLLVGSFQQGLDLVIFKLSQSFIIEKYCVNKDQTEFKCDGKCHLKSVIEQQQDHNNSDDSFVPQEYRSFVFVVMENEESTQDLGILNSNLSKILMYPSEGHYIKLIKPPTVLS